MSAPLPTLTRAPTDFRTHFVKIKLVKDDRAIIGLSAALGIVCFAFIVCVAWFLLVLLPRREARAARRARPLPSMLRGTDRDEDADAVFIRERERRDVYLSPTSPVQHVHSGLA